ncbi:hypothetical protein GH714_031414 [Hevea brasiliensis]|uniref:RING-type domain-containing protein n=1 Tax=Hevea brasiliensis TaxID=3981 RepID=A0A6A6K901_HEVBR|nr:hypothetical protein GH714_031414 [Hevea brasiliensis]
MEEVSTGAIVPAVKSEPRSSASFAAAAAASGAHTEQAGPKDTGSSELEKDFLCPICMQIIKDAFLTACGHSFCYMCIITHLRNKSDCPCCGHYLTSNQLFPNFLLDKLLKKVSARQTSKNASPVERFLQALQQVRTDLQYIKEDIDAVERHRIELYRVRDRYSMKLWMLGDDPNVRKPWPSTLDKNSGGAISSSFSARGGVTAGNLPTKKMDGKSQFNDLQECYLQKRRLLTTQPHKQQESDKNIIHREGYSSGLVDFQSVLSTFTQYSRLRVIAELRHGDIFHSANIVSSIEFDRDDELFATAGVSRRIKVFDFSTVLNDPADVHCPVVEMSTRSKLSCLSWNKYAKNQIASSDYEGIVTVWDVTTRQSVMEYEEHEKRAWSVDFSRTEPSMLVSGSDDCKVKVWCTNQEASVINIDMKANICCVKYNPGFSNYIAVGSADHHIHYYDLRNISHPLHVFSGHRKAVSYVKFLSNNELASASTDSTLRLWDVRTFRGHTNEKNFVGLSVNYDYIACGSETNDVFVYHKEISKPVTWHRFGSPEMDDADEDAGSYFISAVCWKSDSPTMLAANSQGTIKVLILAA